MVVAKSGRTTGLTCASISVVSLDVAVDYYTDCAETNHYMTKTYTNQIGISGNQFSDAGDSGSLVVDAANAEPVGLFFAGGVDSTGVSEGVANPVTEVLNELGSQIGGTSYTFVGTTDHPVSCLNYGNATATAAQARTLASTETTRAEQAMGQARLLVNPSTGILGVASGKSSDHAGEAAVILYVDENASVNVPATVDGVRTMVIPTTAQAVAFGSDSADTAGRQRFSGTDGNSAEPGREHQAAISAEFDAAESCVLRGGGGTEPGQPERSGAGDLRGSQECAGTIAGDVRWDAHALCGDGQAACDAVLRDTASFTEPLHAASGADRENPICSI